MNNLGIWEMIGLSAAVGFGFSIGKYAFAGLITLVLNIFTEDEEGEE